MRRVLATAVAGSLLLLAGCASGDAVAGIPAVPDPVPVAPDLGAVPLAVAAAGSVHYRMEMELLLPGEAPRAFVATGGTDSVDDRMTMVADLSQFSAALGRLEVLVDGDEAWIKPGYPPGAPWAHGGPADLPPSFVAVPDPGTFVELLGATGGDPEPLGTEVVDGEPMQGWRATASMPEGDVPFEVWIDGAGLPRRLDADIEALVGMSGADGSATMTLELFDYGGPVEVVPPPREETIPMREAGELYAELFGEL